MILRGGKDRRLHHEFGDPTEGREHRRRKRRRCLLYIFLFFVFKIVIILVFALTIMKIRTPEFRLSFIAISTFDYSSAAANPSFSIIMYAEFTVKNTNFGHYKFESTTVYFYYNNAVVGSLILPSLSARARSTRTLRVEVPLSSAGVLDQVQLRNDLTTGVLPLIIESKLNGKVELLLKLLKRKKSADLECNADIGVAQRVVDYLSCT